jgi:hypothetical protein
MLLALIKRLFAVIAFANTLPSQVELRCLERDKRDTRARDCQVSPQSGANMGPCPLSST